MFKIIESSSAGNCFKCGSLMIDLGLPYSKTKEHLTDITHILLTHVHGDHLNMTTIRKTELCRLLYQDKEQRLLKLI